ncbi:type II secretion system protein [Ruficoccus amylovorans]|uniref:type II secretion system protein n=1 Tax=Ruficoccus amylovorans TaxID=1804625 RepID=UPI001C8B55A9|nr:type II secretion system protein [Ruficoccus amylovorans]
MKTPLPLSSRRRTSPAFTLIELLTVIAVIGILAAILIPVVGGARRSAMAAKSRYEFTQLANACQSFKADYGWWPMEGSTNPVSTEDSNIIAILSGNQSDYQGARKLNRRMVGYYSPGNTVEYNNKDYTIDGFGNSDINILFDTSGDKVPKISASRVNGTSLKTGNPKDNPSGRETMNPGLPSGDDIRASVVVFSAGDGTKAVGTWVE